MKKTKKIISIVMAACLASVMTVGVFAAGDSSAATSGETQVSSPGAIVSDENNHQYVGGGEWWWGKRTSGNDITYSHYQHMGLNHSATVETNVRVESGIQSPGIEAQAEAPSSWNHIDHCYWATY